MRVAEWIAGWLRAVWDSRGRHGGLTAARVCELCRDLEAEKATLQDFTSAMEQEFLALGSLLRNIVSVAREVRRRSDDIVAAAAGRSEDAAIQFAFQLLKKAEDLVHASRDQYTRVFAVFENMHLDLTKIARERNALMRTLSPLEITIIQFRIHACAFDEHAREQFIALADEIGGIIRDVRTAVGRRFDELERAGQTTRDLTARLTVLAREQKDETGSMLMETRSHLSVLNEALLSSESAAQSISQAGLKIAGGVGRAIVALQCQDMARQKFQHICTAIDEMIGHISSAADAGFRPDAAADCRRFLADASRVQHQQLRAVFGQLDEAARQVSDGLSEVGSEARSFADYAMHSGGATLDGEVIGQAIESINAVLGVIETAVASIRSVIELVRRLNSTFSDCTSQILGLALHLRMVALNAQIFAAHVDAGAALEVIARDTRTIADDAMRTLDEISSRVTALIDSVVVLDQRLGDFGELAAMEQRLLANEAAEAERKLHSLERDLRGALAAVGPLEKELSRAIQRATASIRFPETVRETGAHSTSLFERISLEYSDSRSDVGMAAHHKVEGLKQNYTMVHERVLHDSVVAAAATDNNALPQEAGDPESSREVESDGDQLADNVELF